MSLLRRAQAEPGSTQQPQEQKTQKAELRALRLQRTREAREATRKMTGPEPKYGIYVSVFLVLVAAYSYLSTDSVQKSVTTKGKTHYVASSIIHPAQAIVLVVVALAAAGTIHWRHRVLSGMVYIVAGFFAMQTPVPKTAADLVYILFLVPAGYAAWMLFMRMNKEQREWLNEHYPPAGGAARGSAARNTTRRSATAANAGTQRSRRAASAQGAVSRGSASAPSGRYTPPRAKARAGQRRG